MIPESTISVDISLPLGPIEGHWEQLGSLLALGYTN